MTNELKVGDRVAIRITYRGTIESISNYREPNRKYAIAVDGYPENHIFVGDKEIGDAETAERIKALEKELENDK